MDTLSQIHPSLAKLFDEDAPSAPMLFPMLEGRCPADIRVDDGAAPTQCLIRNGIGVTFASRAISQAFLEEALTDLRETRGVYLISDPETPRAWNPPPPDLEVERLEFRTFDRRSPGYRDALAEPSDGLELHDMDTVSFERCMWRDEMLGLCGSAEILFCHGFGVLLCRDGEVLAEGYAPLLGRGTMEIGVVTAEEHRGNGYATLVAAHAIARCLRKGLVVAWSCEIDNPASAAIARKLGFGSERTYPMLAYRSTKASEGTASA